MLMVKDMEKLNGSWDVYGSIADEIAIAFDHDGTDWLTAAGEKEFKSVLNIPIEVRNDMIIIRTDLVIPREEQDEYEWDNWETYHPLVQKLSDLIWAYAGYCSTEDYDKWFKVSF